MFCFLAWSPGQLAWTGDAAALWGGPPPGDREALNAQVEPKDQPALRDVLHDGGSCVLRTATGRDLLLRASIHEPGAGVACLSTLGETVDEALRQQLSDLAQRFREMMHRTKNNLQTVMSIVSLKLNGLADPQRAADMREVLGKVQAVALAQRALGEHGHVAIALDTYIGELIATLTAMDDVEAPAMTLAPVVISAERAVSAGLIVHELLAAGPVRTVTLDAHEGGRLVLEADAASPPSPLTDMLVRHIGATLEQEGGRLTLILPREG